MSELTIQSELVETRKLRPWLESTISGNFDLHSIELALVELCNNIIEHGYGRRSGQIDLELEVSGSNVHIHIKDQGAAFLLDENNALPEHITVRGYGLHIIQKLAESVSHEHNNGQNNWKLSFSRSQRTETKSCLTPTGRLDAVAAPEFRTNLLAVIDSADDEVVVDLTGLEFCDSSGMAALIAGLKHAQSRNVELHLVRPMKHEVWEIFELTQFDKVFTFKEIGV